jgi:hypothetical protein
MSAPRYGRVALACFLAAGLVASVWATAEPMRRFLVVLSPGPRWSGIAQGQIDVVCDGPHRVYVARVRDSVAISVLRDGCVPLPAEAPGGAR